ncbi:MAG: hypothetical protein HFP77_03505 [Methylococcales symbiont of Iophon sp. n. MRB-2018]|nr:MAG: hypothetical protein HFP77_03505 [Methylococcales symbiont of Iophon sp. n. MRB-2018]KAF3980281.1 MAG: hypothetical protein HFP76_02970 [Methylococcales symbiont of Iophon sp. n. MRB-2018]
MKAHPFFLLFLLYLFSQQSLAINQGGFDYKIIAGNLRLTPGCKSRQTAFKQAASDYRFKKHTKALCQQIAYGWGLAKVEDKGKVICEPCENSAKESDQYQCYVKNVILKCVKTNLGW